MNGILRAWVVVSMLALATAPAATASEPSAGDTSTTAADSLRVPQRDIIDLLGRIFRSGSVKSEYEMETKAGISLTLLPSVGYNPSYGAFVGVSAALGGWLGDPANTAGSKGSAGASYSTTEQISVQVKSDLFLPGNVFVLKGDWRYLDTSQPTYGLGPAAEDQVRYPMDFVLYRFYQTVYRRVSSSPIYVGLGYHYNRWDQIEEPDLPPGASSPYRVYTGAALSRVTASGISANVLFDSRDNPINARRGLYWDAGLRSYLRELGSDETWQSTWSDLRVYPRFPSNSRNTLAIWNYVWFVFGKAPYFDLPAIGWDTYGRGGRGYLQGRIRGENQVYTEGEYRMSLTRDGLLGAVVFVNLTATTLPGGGAFGTMDPGYGVGARVKFSKRTSTNLTVDLSWDEFGTAHVFFGMQEVF